MAADLTSLSIYLSPPGQIPTIGPERGRHPAKGVGRYTSAYGSTRYVWYANGVAVAALQVVSADGKTALVANVYTTPACRRMGLATRLLERARKDFREVKHAPEESLSSAGRAWRDASR